MTKRMLIDDTHPEETRVVVINGNKLEDVEFETIYRRQIKGNIYLGKVMRVEPSLQACFVDYGGNKHGFLAFGEIHPDYYNISDAEMAEIDKEVDDAIEAKKQSIKDREAERERIRGEKLLAREKSEKMKAEKEAAEKLAKENQTATSETPKTAETISEEVNTTPETAADEGNGEVVQETSAEDGEEKKKRQRFRRRPRRNKKNQENGKELKVMSESAGTENESVSEDVEKRRDDDDRDDYNYNGSDSEAYDEDDDEEQEYDFELQRKLLKARKLYHRHSIQDVIKEGQILLVQIVKEERGNKGAALTTYLSLAGRYCVLMPNRIKSGGVSRKITNVADRKRLKTIVKELPLTIDMSIIVRTAGEEKTKADIVRDYNYLIRSWNQIRIGALSAKAPALIHEEGNLIKRALRDIYNKEISEIIVAGDEAYKMAKDFFRILSPHNLKKIKYYRNNDMPLFQRFQIEGQLDKLHETTAQLDCGGYLVINPTEALVSIDVNSGRATKEKDLEETALKTNLEACDEVARQLRMRNLAGLVVIDFIDMDEAANNHAVERRMKEALKKDRSRVQVGKMSQFGLLELSRQRMHSSFFESSYTVCPHCGGKGMIRTVESGAVLVLRGIEEEGIKNRSSIINVFVPSDVAIYLLNHKREKLLDLEKRYGMNVIVSADDSIKNISDYRVDRTKMMRNENEDKKSSADEENSKENRQPERTANQDNRRNNDRRQERRREEQPEVKEVAENKDAPAANDDNNRNRRDNRRDNRRNRRDRDRGRNNNERRFNGNESNSRNDNANAPAKEKQEAVILYNSRGNTTSTDGNNTANDETKEKTTWWKKLIKG